MNRRNVICKLMSMLLLWGLWLISHCQAGYQDYMTIEDEKPASTTSMQLSMSYLHKGVFIFKQQLKLMKEGISLPDKKEMLKILDQDIKDEISPIQLDSLFTDFVTENPDPERDKDKKTILACINKYELQNLEKAAEEWYQLDKSAIRSNMAFKPSFGNLEVNVATKMIYMYQETFLFIFSYKSASIEGDESILTTKGYLLGYGQKTVDMTVVRNLDWMHMIQWIQSLDTPDAVRHLNSDPSLCHAVLLSGVGKRMVEEPRVFSYIIGDALVRRKFKFVINFVMDERCKAFYIWKKEQILIYLFKKPSTEVSFIKLKDIVSLVLEHHKTPDARETLKKEKLFHLSWSVKRNIYSNELVPVAKVLLKTKEASAAPDLVSTVSMETNTGHANLVDQRNGLLFNFGICGRIQVVDMAMLVPSTVLIVRGAPVISRDHVFMSPYQSAKDKTQFIVIIDTVVYSLTVSIRLIINEAGTGVSEYVRSHTATDMMEDFFTLDGRFERIADSRSSSEMPVSDVPFAPSPPLSQENWVDQEGYIYESVKELSYMDPWLSDTSLTLTSKKIMIGVGIRREFSSNSRIDHMQIIDLENRYICTSKQFDHPVRHYLYSSSDEVLFYYDLEAQLLHGIIYNSIMIDHSHDVKKEKQDRVKHEQLKLEAKQLQETCQKRAEQRERKEQEKQEFLLTSERRLQHISLLVYVILFYLL